MTDISAQAAYIEAMSVVGQAVTFQRLVGVAPNVTISPTGGAAVTCVVRDYIVDTTETAESGYSASSMGSITQGDRQILVMSADLSSAGFPLPLAKGDQAVIAATGEVLVITRVDAAKRIMAGCIEAFGTGVA